MTVTATARTSDPSGSPTRRATTSAWCTAANAAPLSTIATINATRGQAASPGEGKRDDAEERSDRRQDRRERRPVAAMDLTFADAATESPYPGRVLDGQRDSSGRPALKVRAIAALTLLGLLVLGAPLVLVPIVGWLVDRSAEVRSPAWAVPTG